MRSDMIAARTTQNSHVGERLAGHVLRDLELKPGVSVAGVWPLPGEIDLRPLWHELHARGHVMMLPETPPRGQALRFRLWTPSSTMVAERFGTQRPDGPHGTPDLIFVPMLAFDRDFYRLGYGGGYYDRTLAAHAVAGTVGFAFAAQEVPEVPREPHDRKLDSIFTEAGRVPPRV